MVVVLHLPTLWLRQDLESETTHRFGPNSFKLHRLPMPRPNEVLGLVGTNGIGKSTALKILAGVYGCAGAFWVLFGCVCRVLWVCVVWVCACAVCCGCEWCGCGCVCAWVAMGGL
jgi:hypothetical protein